MIAQLKVFSLGFFVFIMSPFAAASKPTLNQDTLFDNAKFTWKISRELNNQSLIIDGAPSGKPRFSYDISDCSFCDGDEDNCQMDGVFSFSIQSLNRPSTSKNQLGLVCHVGAHSQRIMIFDPSQELKQPLFTQTGVYFVNYELEKNGIKIQFDTWAENSDQAPQIKTIHWPPLEKQ